MQVKKFKLELGNKATDWTPAPEDTRPAVAISATEPTDKYTGMLWKHTGTVSGLIQNATYRWNGSAWELYYFTAANIDVDTLSAITANLGTVTAGLLKSADGYVQFDLNNGFIRAYDEKLLNYVELSTGKIGFRGKNPASNLASLTMDQYSIYSNINDLSGSPDCVLSFADNDVYIGKTSVFDSDDGSDIIPIYKTLSELNSNKTVYGYVDVKGVGTNWALLLNDASIKLLLGITTINSRKIHCSCIGVESLVPLGMKYFPNDGLYVYFNESLSSGATNKINYILSYVLN